MSYEKLLSQFHSHIHERMAEFGLAVENALPSLDDLLRSKNERLWHQVPGMYGGFSYALRAEGKNLVIDVESWSRVLGGSGKHYVISENAATLVSEGFV